MSFPASAIGHGGLGLRSGQPTLDELVERSTCERRAIADIRVGRVVATSWLAIGAAWRTANIFETFDGVNLELAEVITSAGENLDRVGTQPLVIANAGTFFWNPTTLALFVHLAGNVDPNTVSVLVVFGKYFGSLGVVEPRLDRTRIANGDFSTWTGPTAAANWTGVGSTKLMQDAVNVLNPPYSAKIFPDAGTGLVAGDNGGVSQAATFPIFSKDYIIGGNYRTSLDMPSGGQARIALHTGGGAYMDPDGADTTALTTGMVLAATGGEYKRFLFAFRTPAATTAVELFLLMHNASGATIFTGSVNFDGVWVMPVWRYEFVEPRLPMSGLPPIEIDTQSIAIGEESVGLGQMRLLNGDHPDSTITNGYLETFFGDRDVIGRQCQVWSLGALDNGAEITMDAAWPVYAGTVQDFDVGDMDATLPVQDTRAILREVLPRDTVSSLYTVAGGASPNDLSRPLPIVIGGLHLGIKAPRVALGTTNRLPIFLFNDPTWGLGTNICGQIQMWAYTDQAAADRIDTTRRVACEFTVDQLTGLVSMFSNPGPFEVLGDSTSANVVREVKPNDTLDYVDNGIARAAALTPGLYTCTTLAAHAQAVMNALGFGTFTVNYNNSGAAAHKFSFVKTGGAGNFLLSLNAGANKHRSAWPLFGFSGNTDPGAAANYDSTAAVYDETRADQFEIRIDGTGYRDDAVGTYTGIAGGGDTALIYQPVDVLPFILRKMCRRPSWEVDATFAANRATGINTQAIYLGGFGQRTTMTVQQVVDMIANGAYADAVISGNGVWTWKPRATSAAQMATQAAGAPILVDRDFIAGTFRSGKSGEDTFGAVSVVYGEINSSGAPLTREYSNSLVALRHNRGGAAQVIASLFEPNDAQQRAFDNMLLRVLPRRRLTFTIRGRMMRRTMADLLRVQRTKMLQPEAAGMLNDDVFRIQAVGLDPQTFETRMICYTADLPRTADAIPAGYSITPGPTRGRPADEAQRGPTRFPGMQSNYKGGLL